MIETEPIVVYPIREKGGSRWQNNELRFSLRSLDRFFRLHSGAHPKVFILTTAHIPFLRHEHLTVLPVKGYIQAVQTAWSLAREHSPTGDYIWMNDDIGFMCPTVPSDLFPAIHTGPMAPNRGEARTEVGGWRFKLIKVRDRLAGMGLRPFNFSTHSPYLFNADKMEMVCALFGMQYKTPLETAYFNYWSSHIPNRRSDNRFVRHQSKSELPLDFTGRRFYNYADGGLNDLLKGFLHGMFPNPSRYERI